MSAPAHPRVAEVARVLTEAGASGDVGAEAGALPS